MKRFVHIKGVIQFDPNNVTTKHNKQSSWKRMVIINIEGETHLLYNWFINRRYNITLNPPLRGTHLTLVNDSVRDFKDISVWDSIKQKWDGKEVDIWYDTDVRSNSEHWWLRIPEEHRETLNQIRSELTLGPPHFGYHITIGYANEKNAPQSEYIYSMIKQGFIQT